MFWPICGTLVAPSLPSLSSPPTEKIIWVTDQFRMCNLACIWALSSKHFDCPTIFQLFHKTVSRIAWCCNFSAVNERGENKLLKQRKKEQVSETVCLLKWENHFVKHTPCLSVSVVTIKWLCSSWGMTADVNNEMHFDLFQMERELQAGSLVKSSGLHTISGKCHLSGYKSSKSPCLYVRSW